MELPYILLLLCHNRNQVYANIMHTLVEKYNWVSWPVKIMTSHFNNVLLVD